MNTNLWDSIQPALKNSGKILLVSAMTLGLVACAGGGGTDGPKTAEFSTAAAVGNVAASLCNPTGNAVASNGFGVDISNTTVLSVANTLCSDLAAKNIINDQGQIVNIDDADIAEFADQACTLLGNSTLSGGDNAKPKDMDGNDGKHTLGAYKNALQCQ